MSGTGPQPVRVGVLGCGGIARWAHLPALSRSRRIRLVAAADPDPHAREKAARWTRELHEDADELLTRTDLDAVVVAVPTDLHAEVAEAVCVAGKHVYLEKPLASDRVGAERIARAATTSTGTLAVGFNRRSHPTFQRARTAIRAGVIGRVRTIQTTFCEPSPDGPLPGWRRRRGKGGGVLLDLGSHHVDLVRWILGQEITSGEARTEDGSSEQDSAWVRWKTDGDVEVQSFFSYRASFEDRMTFVGERGSLRVDRHRFTVEIDVARRGRYGPRRRRSFPQASELFGRAAGLVGHVYDPSYRAALESWVSGLGAHPPEARPATLEDGLRALDAVFSVET